MLRGMNYNGVIMMGKLALRLCLISYYANGSGSITSIGEERANLSTAVYL